MSYPWQPFGSLLASPISGVGEPEGVGRRRVLATLGTDHAMNSLFGPFTLIAFGEHAPKVPATHFDTLDAAKAAVAALVIPEGARVLVMGNRHTPFGSIRLPVA